MTRPLRVGTRQSALARAQTELVIAMLRAAHPASRLEPVPLSTEGDDRPDVSLRQLGGTGAFVKRIERALIDGEIDLAVHSLKDVPTAVEPGLVLAAFPPRGDPRDALVLRPGSSEPPHGARVGTGSSRRAVQLLAWRPDLRLEDVRGNVDTRLRKLDGGQFDGLVLAVAGLERLGRADRVSRALDPDELMPMVGQGALAVQARADDAETLALASAIDHQPTRSCVEAERAFLARLGAGCALPVGALATVEGGELLLRVMLASDAGRVVRRAGRAAFTEATALASRLADEALAAASA